MTLPRFSAKAARKVKDKVPVPEHCPHCSSPVRFACNEVVYGQPYGDWPWLYLCENPVCRAYVGTHPQTNIPLGTLATADLRAARKSAKEVFNGLWQTGRMTRSEAYGWLAARMNIPVAACHFGWFDEAQCAQAIALIQAPPPPLKKTTAKDFADLKRLLGA